MLGLDDVLPLGKDEWKLSVRCLEILGQLHKIFNLFLWHHSHKAGNRSLNVVFTIEEVRTISAFYGLKVPEEEDGVNDCLA